MKLTICLFALLAALCLAAAQAQQASPNESLAYARLIAAHTLPTVTHGQCITAQGDWTERDKADKKEPWWFQRISTEELARMASLSTACATEVGKIHTAASANNAGMFMSRSGQFHWEMLRRAETILHDHALIQNYLLQP